MAREVILVDEHDRPVGRREKLLAHQRGELHRAFSVFLFDSAGRWLLQRRHTSKYHSGGLWTNTCCSHPAPGEETGAAARARLREEMGIDAPLEPLFQFTYRAAFDNGLIEHELDHVFTGTFDGSPKPDPTEVSDWRWVETVDLLRELDVYPENFTYWFRVAVEQVLMHQASTRR